MQTTRHFQEMLKERGIDLSWAELAVSDPEKVEEHDDGTRHYLRRIEGHANRWLRVVVNVSAEPNRAVTAFFDRRWKGVP